MKRWTRFVKDVDEIRHQATSVDIKEPLLHQSFPLPPEVEFSSEKGSAVDPPSLLEKFDAKWKTGTKPLTVGALLEATS